MADDVMIESIQSIAEEDRAGGSERSKEGLRQNDYTRQFSNSSNTETKEDGTKSNEMKGEQAAGALPRPSSDANISIQIEEEDLEDSANVIAKLDRKKRQGTAAERGRAAGVGGLRPDDFYPHAS